MTQRLNAYAILIVAATVVGVAALPWISFRTIYLGLSWNGFGAENRTPSADEVVDVSPAGPGWFLLAACLIAALAAASTLIARTRVYARPALWVAAGCALIATAIPITVLVNPEWYAGEVMTQIGGTALPLRDFLRVQLVSSAVGLLILLAVLCAITATLTPGRKSDTA